MMGKPSKKIKTEVPKKKEGSEPPAIEKTTLEQIKPPISNNLSKEIENGDGTPDEKPTLKDEMTAPISISPKDTTGNESKQGNYQIYIA